MKFRVECDRTEKAMVQHGFRLDRVDAIRLRDVAKKKGVPHTALIRNAVIRYLDQVQLNSEKIA